MRASRWWQLIDLDETYGEPGITEQFSTSYLFEMLKNGEKLQIPSFPGHSQSVERAVKLVSEPSQRVYGFKNRHDWITSSLVSHSLRPKFLSKGQYTNQYDSIF